ncbi:protein takeout-like [Bacillus rossius redtenbacheri]|uniref:protein takeout-like n=1 Tax=Bacillus rossius redtenbacheri TaxID=93214 RepID=UPI002FDDD7FA
MKCAAYVAVLAVLVRNSHEAILKLPTYLKPCSRNDSNFNACALKNGISALPKLVKGDASLHIPVLDPLRLDRIDVKQGSGPVRVELALTDVSVQGLKDADLKAIDFDLAKNTLNVNFIVKKRADVSSRYSVDGQILVLPIKGDGDFNLKIDGLEGTFKCKFDLIKKEDGKQYAKIRDNSFDFEISNAIFDLKNLFNGDKVLGDTMNTFLNENWREVYGEIKPAVAEVVRTVIVRILDEFTSLLPYDELFAA